MKIRAGSIRFMSTNPTLSSAGIAVLLSLGAGLATALGGCIVYFKSLVKLANKRFLSCTLGFSAGVMIFLSFAEMFIESKQLWKERVSNEKLASLFASLSLISGIIFSVLMELLLHKGQKVEFDLANANETEINKTVHGGMHGKAHLPIEKKTKVPEKEEEGILIPNLILHEQSGIGYSKSLETEVVVVEPPKQGYELQSISGSTRDLSQGDFFINDDVSAKLHTVSILSAAAIAIHNIPEGVVTFIGYLADPAVGISLAIGIAAHNIPEGLSVALPVFYATGKRTKAFVWALLSGLAEPLGALICYLFLQDHMSNSVFGFLYGFTAGIMTHISIYELLPTGISLSGESNLTCTSFIIGMAFIMFTLCLV